MDTTMAMAMAMARTWKRPRHDPLLALIPWQAFWGNRGLVLVLSSQSGFWVYG